MKQNNTNSTTIKEENIMKKLNNREARQANGGGYCCTICGYGREAYRSKLNVVRHILRKHFGIFS